MFQVRSLIIPVVLKFSQQPSFGQNIITVSISLTCKNRRNNQVKICNYGQNLLVCILQRVWASHCQIGCRIFSLNQVVESGSQHGQHFEGIADPKEEEDSHIKVRYPIYGQQVPGWTILQWLPISLSWGRKLPSKAYLQGERDWSECYHHASVKMNGETRSHQGA